MWFLFFGLQNIVKTYDHGTEGYDVIVEALSAMTNIAHHINDMKRRHEHAVRVQEIQSLLYGWQVNNNVVCFDWKKLNDGNNNVGW